MNKKVCVIGLGYIGLPTSALLANKGYYVHGVDVLQSTVDIVNQGKIHIVEPELATFVKAAVSSGNLKADIKPTRADIFIIAVPTPFNDSKSNIPIPNIDYILSATKSIAPYIKQNNMIILESTSPVGTTDKVEETLKFEGVDTSCIYISHCPERVLPGQIMRELVENDRIVGGQTEESTQKTAEFYNTFVEGEVLLTDAKTAEMAKLTENSFRDTNIAFANELSILCDKFDINVWELIKLANRHPRVNILNPSPGVGGHCIAVDPWFIVHAGGEDAKIIKTAREVNNYKTEWVIEKIKNESLKFENQNGRKAKIAYMGLAFKPNIDDLRESPSLYIVERLTNALLDIVCMEPNLPLDYFNDGHIKLSSIDKALNSSDIVVFSVAHKEFRDIKLGDSKIVMDFCGVLNK